MAHHFSLDFVAAPSSQGYASPGWLTDVIRFYKSSVGDYVTVTLPDEKHGFRLTRSQVADLVRELQKFVDTPECSEEEIQAWIRAEVEYLTAYTDRMTLGLNVEGRPFITKGRSDLVKRTKDTYDLSLADALRHLRAVEASFTVHVTP